MTTNIQCNKTTIIYLRKPAGSWYFVSHESYLWGHNDSWSITSHRDLYCPKALAPKTIAARKQAPGDTNKWDKQTCFWPYCMKWNSRWVLKLGGSEIETLRNALTLNYPLHNDKLSKMKLLYKHFWIRHSWTWWTLINYSRSWQIRQLHSVRALPLNLSQEKMSPTPSLDLSNIVLMWHGCLFVSFRD